MAHQKFAPSRGECHWAVQAGKGRVRGVMENFHNIWVVKHGQSTRNWDTCPLRSSLMRGLVDDKHPCKFSEIIFTTLVRVSPGTIPGKEKSLRWVSPGQYQQVLSVFQRNPLFQVVTPSKMILYYLSSSRYFYADMHLQNSEYNEQFILFPLHLYILFSAAASISNHRSSKLKYLKANVYKMSFSQQIADVYRISIYFLCFVWLQRRPWWSLKE